MTKLRKQRRRKTYRHNVNRKRLRNKINNVGNITCKEIKYAWEKNKPVARNLTEMGLAYDPNKTIKIPTRKEELLKTSVISNEDDEWKEEIIEKTQPNKLHVVKALEADAKAPREKMFRLPKGQVQWITYLMDKYKKDYKAMARDRKNYYQETWRQIRAKIRKFKSIPAQYSVYLQERNLMEDDSESAASSDEEL